MTRRREAVKASARRGWLGDAERFASIAEPLGEEGAGALDEFPPPLVAPLEAAGLGLEPERGQCGEVALELLREVGPLAVSSANSTGDPAAMDVDAAESMLGDSVAVYLDGGTLDVHDGVAASTGSTIVDATGLSTGDGLRIWSPDGRPVGHIPTEGPCANLAFGGPDGRRLFLCAGKRVLAIETKVRGAAIYSGGSRP